MVTGKYNEEAYVATRKELTASGLSNSKIYDRSILNLSASILGVSLAFGWRRYYSTQRGKDIATAVVFVVVSCFCNYFNSIISDA